MRVRVKAPETHAIWYVEVDDAAAGDALLLRTQVAGALKCQFGRLDELEISHGDGDPLLVIKAAHRPQHWWSPGA